LIVPVSVKFVSDANSYSSAFSALSKATDSQVSPSTRGSVYSPSTNCGLVIRSLLLLEVRFYSFFSVGIRTDPRNQYKHHNSGRFDL